MRERAELVLKVICWALVAVLLFQTGRALTRSRPFAKVTIPSVPTLASDTNSTAGATNSAIAKAPENLQTNLSMGTNQLGTNRLVASQLATNLLAELTATNLPPVTNHATNLPPILVAKYPATNAPGMTNVPLATNAVALASSLSQTNPLALTNAPSQTNADQSATNGMTASAHKKKPSRSRTPMPGGGAFFPGMFGMGGMGGPGKPLPELPAVDKARIDKIVESELLGPVMHPQPKALMGIAGNVAFLRSDSGETGLVKVGDSIGDLKLLRIGINRVLVEQNGQKQEMTIFDGMGGESLLTTSDKNPNETTNH